MSFRVRPVFSDHFFAPMAPQKFDSFSQRQHLGYFNKIKKIPLDNLLSSDLFRKAVEGDIGKVEQNISKINFSNMTATQVIQFDKNSTALIKKLEIQIERLSQTSSIRKKNRIKQTILNLIGEANQQLQNMNQRLKGMTKRSTFSLKKVNMEWDNAVQKAKFNKRIPAQIRKNFPAVCKEIFLLKAEKLSIDISPEQRQEFQSKILGMTDSLVESLTFIQQSAGYNDRSRIICADAFIENLLAVNSKPFLSPCPKNNSTEPIQISCFCPGGAQLKPIFRSKSLAREIKNICLRGGGGKGLGYTDMLKELGKQGKLDSLDKVAGSSAGGIAAVALGIGTPYEELGEFCDEIQASISSKQSKETLREYTFLEGKIKGFGLLGSAAGVIGAVDRSTNAAVQGFCGQDAVQAFIKEQKGTYSVLNEDEIARLERLAQRQDIPSNERDMVTFHDLEILRKIRGEGIDNHFRSLTLTGWDATDVRELYFDAKHTPSMPIAYATRVTMALPGAFKGLDLDITQYNEAIKVGPLGTPHRLLDGGIGSNSPTEVFVKKPDDSASEDEKLQYQIAQQETLTCIFDDSGNGFKMESFKYEYSNVFVAFFLWLMGAVKNISAMRKIHQAEDRKLDDIGNVFVVGHGDLGTLSMSPSEDRKRAAGFMSELMTSEWCREHEDEAALLETHSLDALLRTLSLEQLLSSEIIGSPEITGSPEEAIANINKEMMATIKQEIANRLGALSQEDL